MNGEFQAVLTIAGAAGIGTAFGGIGAYLAIRADLVAVLQRFEDYKQSVDQRFKDFERAVWERFAMVEHSAAKAHQRIDVMMHERKD